MKKQADWETKQDNLSEPSDYGDIPQYGSIKQTKAESKFAAATQQKKELTKELTKNQRKAKELHEAKINRINEQTESIKIETELKAKYADKIFNYLYFYTAIVIIITVVFLYVNNDKTYHHNSYIIMALIGSMAGGIFSCVRSVADGLFGKQKKNR